MSTTEVQVRFAAEFALFLVSLAGLGYASLRPDLLVDRTVARAAAATAFAALAAAALLSGALIVDDATGPAITTLRVAGVVLLAVASRWWRPANGGRTLLWIGLLALVVDIGLFNLLRLRYGLLSLDKAAERASRRFRARLSTVILADGAHAIDVDNARTYEIVAELLERRAA